MKQAIVTGVSMGLGAALTDALLAAGYRVLGIGRSPGKHTGAFEFAKADLRDTRALSEADLPGVELFRGFKENGMLVPPDLVAAKLYEKLITAPVESGRTYQYKELVGAV